MALLISTGEIGVAYFKSVFNVLCAELTSHCPNIGHQHHHRQEQEQEQK
jgi:hypothetical protein